MIKIIQILLNKENGYLKGKGKQKNLFNNYIYKSSHTDNKKISENAPEWFHIFPDWKMEQYKKYLAKNEDTINIISKHQSWLTTSPKTFDRKRPLEKKKVLNVEETSQIMPKWMQIKHKKSKKEDSFKSTKYYPIKQKTKKMMIFVDKDINPPKNRKLNYNKNRSIFSYGDFRHNVITEKQHKYYDSKVSQEPKKFFDWDDKKRFNPKSKKDI